MSRRGRSGPTISLFSFQDIITSVTAIVTVITLLLALDLVQRKQTQGSTSTERLSLELTERLSRTEEELVRLRAQTGTTDDLIREVATTSPAELRREIAERDSSIKDLEIEKSRLEKETEAWTAREKEQLVNQFEVESLKEELVDIELSITEIERQQAEERSEGRTIFTLPRGIRASGWVVEVSSTQIAAAPMGRRERPVKFVSAGLPLLGSSPTDNFEKWIEDQKISSEYFFVLIRPDGAHEFDLLQKMLTRRRIAYGFDLVNAERTVLHPERGAAK